MINYSNCNLNTPQEVNVMANELKELVKQRKRNQLLEVMFDISSEAFKKHEDEIFQLRAMLHSVLELQAENYGNGMQTHIELKKKAKDIRDLINQLDSE
ncbi:coil containing protein [Vibrio phage 1.243.O._10N.261.54.B5]|nr:coil containing protein [Vibrio phage 1.243.O._10N.261.54.B5]